MNNLKLTKKTLKNIFVSSDGKEKILSIDIDKNLNMATVVKQIKSDDYTLYYQYLIRDTDLEFAKYNKDLKWYEIKCNFQLFGMEKIFATTLYLNA